MEIFLFICLFQALLGREDFKFFRIFILSYPVLSWRGIVHNGGGMKRWGLRATILSSYTELDAC